MSPFSDRDYDIIDSPRERQEVQESLQYIGYDDYPDKNVFESFRNSLEDGWLGVGGAAVSVESRAGDCITIP